MPSDSPPTPSSRSATPPPLPSPASDTHEIPLFPLSRAVTPSSLPPYSARHREPPPYRSSTAHPAAPSLNPTWLREHLLLLAAFSRLQSKVRGLSFGGRGAGSCPSRGTEAGLRELDECGRWGLFVEVAARRFGIWQERAVAKGVAELPPLDVLMVWCAYLGSPGWYAEDAYRLTPYHPGALFPDFPLHTIAGLIDPETLAYSPGAAAESSWKQHTTLVFDPLEYFKVLNQVAIQCPRCEQSFSVSWLDDTGSGYGQQWFEAKCDFCKLMVTKEAIAVRRLVNDIHKLYIATSSRLASHMLYPAFHSSSSKVLSVLFRHAGESPSGLGDRWRWRRHNALADLLQLHDSNLGGPNKAHSRLISAYVGAEHASVDLVPATMRHATFVVKLHEIGWLRPRRWEERAETLDKAIGRYQGFLTLAAELPNKLIVPTLGIEIAWQTHLLLASQYGRDTQAKVGRLFDREEAVEQGVLAAAFDDTAQRWQARFGVLYSTSGHLLPDGSALARLSSRLRLSSPSLASGTIDYALPLIYGADDSALSHPSERNAIVLITDRKACKARKRRAEEFQDRLTHSVKMANKGLVDVGLVERAKTATPAFVADDPGWTSSGPTGYPATAYGVIASGNVLHTKGVFYSSSTGSAPINSEPRSEQEQDQHTTGTHEVAAYATFPF